MPNYTGHHPNVGKIGCLKDTCCCPKIQTLMIEYKKAVEMISDSLSVTAKQAEGMMAKLCCFSEKEGCTQPGECSHGSCSCLGHNYDQDGNLRLPAFLRKSFSLDALITPLGPGDAHWRIIFDNHQVIYNITAEAHVRYGKWSAGERARFRRGFKMDLGVAGSFYNAGAQNLAERHAARLLRTQESLESEILKFAYADKAASTKINGTVHGANIKKSVKEPAKTIEDAPNMYGGVYLGQAVDKGAGISGTTNLSAGVASYANPAPAHDPMTADYVTVEYPENDNDDEEWEVV